MNEVINTIMRRRTVRQFRPEQIKDAELKAILDAAIVAPSAMNMQQWHFTVVQKKELLDRMVEIIKENIMNMNIEFLKQRASEPGYHTFYHAPTVIIISGDEKSRFIQIDCGAAAENIALAAVSLNIGSCVMTSPDLLFASEKGRALRKELGIPEGYKFVCAVALGYVSGSYPERPPKNTDVFTYIK